ncbi:MAG: hypothetical protein ACI95K_001900, partial [Lentimonas sp.]
NIQRVESKVGFQNDNDYQIKKFEKSVE